MASGGHRPCRPCPLLRHFSHASGAGSAWTVRATKAYLYRHCHTDTPLLHGHVDMMQEARVTRRRANPPRAGTLGCLPHGSPGIATVKNLLFGSASAPLPGLLAGKGFNAFVVEGAGRWLGELPTMHDFFPVVFFKKVLTHFWQKVQNREKTMIGTSVHFSPNMGDPLRSA